ncbi:hypothetical protein P7C71_g5652, partial [Lecanoromycetidae sp. Uapishka_2]
MSRAYVPMASRPTGVEMFQKGNVQSVFASRPMSQATEIYDTDFEEDMSDFEEYEGRRSEESFGNRSNTTVSTFEELRTPASNELGSFNFQLQMQEKAGPMKAVEGPVGPHLFRISQDSTPEQEIHLDWSPVSPEEHRAGPNFTTAEKMVESAPNSSVPLEAWTPQQVAYWMRSAELDQGMVEKLLMHDISGAIVKDLQFADLKELGIVSFGQRHQVWDKIKELRGGVSVPSTPAAEQCYSPNSPIIPAAGQEPDRGRNLNTCSNPASPQGGKSRSPAVGGRRRARRALRPDDVISPGESASIVAIEQLLPKPHHCSKGENCSKWRKQQRQLARIAKEFPLEFEQISADYASPTSPSEVTVRPTSEAVPSVVASSDLLGPGRLPSLQINEEALRVVQTRDPQDNVRQFLTFQHMDEPVEEPTTPPYEMFPPLSPPNNTQAPHNNLSRLPKLTIPMAQPEETFSPSHGDRTVRPGVYTPATAIQYQGNGHDIFRLGSPASAMDVPVTSIPLGPVARDDSQSVPPDMRFGQDPVLSRSSSRGAPRQPWSPIERPQTSHNFERSRSNASHRRQPGFAMAPVEETHLPVIDDEKTPTVEVADVNHAGWMKKRKTKMLRHEWHENYFRLHGTRLAMHRDSKATDALDLIDVDEYAVACSSLASGKLNTAFKSLKLNGKKKDGEASAFEFQLVPAAEKKGFLNAATGKTHHFAVKHRDERIDWMRELMLAKALRQKADGCEINVNGNMI